jgi:hypothetical protein
MKVALIAALSGALLAIGAQALPGAVGSSEDSPDALVQPAAERTTEDDDARREDRREERRKDRREDRRETAGTTTTETTTTTTPTRTAPAPPRPEDNGVAGDVSGPCDEAEHANDPRCTGVGVRDDDRGDDDRGHDDRGGDDDRHDNSGPGSENSGRGSGGDDDDDRSGSGHGGDDDD